MSVIRDVINSDGDFREKLRVYVETIWWPAVNRDPTQYNYWRMTAQKRMGKFKVVRSEGQEVIQE